MSDFSRLFEANSVAIIGASENPETISGRPQHFLRRHGFEGDIFPVNPKYDEIRGEPCYDSVLDVPTQIDVAIILVSAEIVPTIITECGDSDVPFAIISASGFSEVDNAGEALQSTIEQIAERQDIRIVGPNCLGVVNLSTRQTLSFSSMLDRDRLTDGPLAFVTQSGSFGGAVFQMTQEMGIGTKYWVSTGNEADVDAVELMDYLVEDSDVEVIIAYVESLKRGRQFMRVARKALKHSTPILMLKVGRSERGKLAASSHTGKMTSGHDVYEEIFEENGVLELDSIGAFKHAVMAFTTVSESRFPRGNGAVAVITASGGAGVLIADACNRENVQLADLSQTTRTDLQEIIPPYGSTINPIDVTGNTISTPSIFKDCISSVLSDPAVASVILQFGNSGGSMGVEYREYICEIANDTDKLVISVFTGGRPPSDVLETYRESGIPTFEDPVRAVQAVSLLSRFRSATDEFALESASDEKSTAVAESRSLPSDNSWSAIQQITAEFDISVASGEVAEDPTDAIQIAGDLGYPVVLKGVASGLRHKTEANAVRTNIRSDSELRVAFDEIVSSLREADDTRTIYGVLVQEQIDDGLETIVGIISDTDFGPVMMFGAGGIYTEAFQDVSYRPLPVNRRQATELIESTKTGRILQGYRGNEYDTDSLVELLVQTSRLFESYEDLTEIELNPVLVDSERATAVDVVIEREKSDT